MSSYNVKFCNDTGVDLQNFEPNDVLSQLCSLRLIPEEIMSVLGSLPVGKASDPDGINNCILRELAVEISVPFCCLFNNSLGTGIFPDDWKRSNVSPIDKSGDKSSTSNYRPITLLCNPEKFFERVVFKHLYNHLQDNQILSPLQSGFIYLYFVM